MVLFKNSHFGRTAAALLLGLSIMKPATADARGGDFEVSITNLTQAQIISPFIVSTHKRYFPIFKAGEPATPELAAIAQDADNSGMEALLTTEGQAQDLAIAEGPVLPGQTVSVIISGERARYLNLAAMLVTTNDAFIGLNSVRLRGYHRVYNATAYDSGSEDNDESCAYIPGPPCGNAGVQSEIEGEGFVYPHPGIQGEGDLSGRFDWNNPVAYIRVKRVN